MGDPVVWWDLGTQDAERSVSFFEDVFDWKPEYDEDTGFYRVRLEEQELSKGGIFALRKAKLPFVTLYVLVDDIEEKSRLVEEHGGSVEAPFSLASGSRICLFNEPSGVTFAMIQPKTDE